MSLEADITIIKQLLEAVPAGPVFKAASPSNLAKRSEYRAIEQAKEEEAKKREFAQRIASLGPKFSNIKELATSVEEINKRYIDLCDQEFRGNYGSIGDYDHATKVSFNIKVYGNSIPSDVLEKLQKYDLEETAYERMQEDMVRTAEDFFNELKTDYLFINSWYGEGRSGGWVVFEIDDVDGASDAEDLLYNFTQSSEIEEMEYVENWPDVAFRSAYSQLAKYGKALEQRIRQLYAIENKIEKGKRDVIKWQSSKEYWDDFLSDHSEDMAEKDEEITSEVK